MLLIPSKAPAHDSGCRVAPVSAVQEPLRAPKQPSLRGAEVYLDESADAFLKACRAAGEVLNSAVILLALLELSSTMRPIEVARVLLLGDNSARRVPGRKLMSCSVVDSAS